MTLTLIDSLKSARRVSTPLVAIQTPDPVATIQRIAADVGGDAPKVQWDFCSGLTAVNPQGEEAIAIACACPACHGAGETDEGVCQTCDGRRMLFSPTDSRANPAGVLAMLRSMPSKTMAFIQNAHRFLADVGFIQGVSNLRDLFKQDHRTLILLAPAMTLPPELAGDFVVFDEPLPDGNAAREIILAVHRDADVVCDDQVLERATAAVQGLPAFQIEQHTARCLTRDGLDLDALWEAKRRQVEQTPGLRIFRDAVRFGLVLECRSATNARCPWRYLDSSSACWVRVKARISSRLPTLAPTGAFRQRWRSC